jgi:hypothetical protein
MEIRRRGREKEDREKKKMVRIFRWSEEEYSGMKMDGRRK